MLVSLKEIGKYVDLSGLTAEEIASRLTFSGIEVEEIKKSADATNLVIGEVLSCENHPNSDHLHVCKVDVKDEILDIVCGAPNVRKGLKVIVAKAGAVLQGNKVIEKGEIRGQVSNGMLCALNEIGVDPKYLKPEQIAGIEELPSDAPIGETNVLGYLGLDDTILDLSLLANRSDCYSLFNVAREIGALFNRKVTIPSYKDEPTYKDDLLIDSKSQNCKSFYAKVVKGIKVKESPKWLKQILQSEGIRSIDNIVDAGNYVMLLTGQPVHCYDYDKLNKKELIVKDDIEETFVALDEKPYEIKKGDLCVTSDNKTMCLAGIMGGENSEISSSSTNVVLEVANFAFSQIRRTSIRLGLSSDSSTRFIKGINKDQSEEVLALFVHILKEVSEVSEVSETIKYDCLNHDKKIIECSKDYINNRLGSSFSYSEIKEVLTLLNFEIEDIDENNFKAVVPSYRIDIDGKADLSEEIIRYKGFDNIKNELPVMETTVGSVSKIRKRERLIESFLLDNGINEVLSYTLINEKDNNLCNFINKNEGIVIFNPLTEDRKFIRKNIMTSLLRVMEYNVNHKETDFSIFEISNVYSKGDKEEIHLGIVLEGNNLSKDKIVYKAKDYYDMKGLLDSILSMFNIELSRVKYLPLKSEKELHPGRSAEVILDGKRLAVLGEIHPSFKDEFSLKKEPCVVLEMNLSLLFATRSANNKFFELSKYPSVKRDYAFILNDEYQYIQVRNEIKKISSLIKDVRLFDVYKGEHVKSGFSSIALSLTLESMEGTLKDEQINEIDNKVKETLLTKFKAELRG